MPFAIVLAEPHAQIIVKDSFFPDIVNEDHPETNLLNQKAFRDGLATELLVGDDMDGNLIAIFRHRIAFVRRITVKDYLAYLASRATANAPKIDIPVRIPTNRH